MPFKLSFGFASILAIVVCATDDTERELSSCPENLEKLPNIPAKNFRNRVRACVRRGNCRSYGPIQCWDTSDVRSMDNAFKNLHGFNAPIGSWNTSSVTSTKGMFHNAKAFNQVIKDWDTSNVRNTRDMFHGAEAFDRFIRGWDVAKVTSMARMFKNAKAYNMPVDKWNTTNVRRMNDMFRGAEKFNKPINDWSFDNVMSMDGMFQNATAFDQCLNDLDGKVDTNAVTLNSIFVNSGCPIQTTPDGSDSAWCQAAGCAV